MAKCQELVSIQGLLLLSMVLLASSTVCACIINGQTKEDINTRSVMMTTTSSASYKIGSGEHPLTGVCVQREDGGWWCGNVRFRTYLDCSSYCRKHFDGKDN
ncbi:hypothetical protein BDA96_07G041900 [Sorghum bicolor]|uniref:Uncharacterized protein n=2 Tax=Sorghum bicolor TaxID=4558 RepID=C5YGT0_SORBI|nr:hypothetical protein SORBI_3007G039870 [Sorghum bicolor]KAG0522494.1 hypothetical protein BDA96_07G041900 [Sorghum bicolor]OQU79873.1 hypothetical protein SORBI_3007G039700 [Sorghum bicolor]